MFLRDWVHLGRKVRQVRDVSAGLGAFEAESATGP